jgi:hypothetical protein
MSYRRILQRARRLLRRPGEEDESRATVVTSNEPDPSILTPGPPADQFQLEVLEPHGYREFCLERLKHLLALRAALPNAGQLDADLQRRLVERALYSAYCDCVGAGAKRRAARILARASDNADEARPTSAGSA